MRKRNMAILILFCLALGFGLSLPIVAEEHSPQMPEGYEAIGESLPDDVVEALPEGALSPDADEQEEALRHMTSPSYWLSWLSDTLRAVTGDGARMLAVLCGLLLFAAILRTVRSSIASPSLGGAVDFCSVGAIFAGLLHWQSEQLSSVAQCFERLHALMLSTVPVWGTLLAMGGNVSTAAAAGGSLSFFLTVSESLCAKSVLPVSGACTALVLCRAISPDSGLSGLHNAIRKIYTFTLGLVMTLLCALLSAQTTLCAASDSMGARTARLVSATVIPVVGGAVGETLRTLGAGVQYLKSVFGIGAILFLCLLILPTLLSLLVARLVLLLGSGVAEMLGCERESRLLSELGSVWGMMIAVLAISGVAFLLTLTMLTRQATAAA